MFRLHDRRLLTELKIFHMHNVNVSRDPMKVTRLREADNIYTTTDYNWAPLTSMKHIIDALINFSMINTALWPYDLCGQMLMKLYNKYNWIGYSIKEEKKVAFICEHFRRVSEANTTRAGQDGTSPLKFQEMERLLKMMLSEEGLSTSPPASDSQLGGFLGQGNTNSANQRNNQQGGGGGRGRGRGGKGAGQPGARQQRPPMVAPNGRKLCFNYNKHTGCQNPPLPHIGGCKDLQTQAEYAHACSWHYSATCTLCLQNHPKSQHPR